MSNYREKYFKENKSVFGKYQCTRCKQWFPKSQIDIDHIIPQSKGGTDDLWNLQAMCYHCNRSKQDSLKDTPKDLVKNIVKTKAKSIISGILKRR